MLLIRMTRTVDGLQSQEGHLKQGVDEKESVWVLLVWSGRGYLVGCELWVRHCTQTPQTN